MGLLWKLPGYVSYLNCFYWVVFYLQAAITETDLEQFHITEVGYNSQVNGLRLLKNSFIHKLNQFYQANGGAIYYNAPYILPRLDISKNGESVI